MHKPLNIKAVADFLSLSTDTIAKYLSNKKFPKPDYIIGGKKIRYWTQAAVNKWLESHRQHNTDTLAAGK